MNKNLFYPSLILLLITISCVAQLPKQPSTTYEEDLSALREPFREPFTQKPTFPTDLYLFSEQNYTVNRTLHTILDSIASLNRQQRYISGYTIRIYSGINKQTAIKIKSKMLNAIEEDELKNFDIRIEYRQPNFLVTTGNYFTTLEAQSDLICIKKYFPKTILIPRKILLEQK